MDELMDEISKKDLLVETGISYGQLYRWKREGLIPEEWFVKRASFTGQETFFPRARVLDRIRTILTMKDEQSLDDIRRALRSAENSIAVPDGFRTIGWDEAFVDGLAALERLETLRAETFAAIHAVYEAGREADAAPDELRALTNDVIEKVAAFGNGPAQVVLAKANGELVFLLEEAAGRISGSDALEILKIILVCDALERLRAAHPDVFSKFGAQDAQNKNDA